MTLKLLRLCCVAFLPVFPALADQILINEIMYHPSPDTPEDTSQEWIEFYNKGATSVDLTGWKISKGVSFTFPSVTLPAGGYLVVSANTNSFHSRYPSVANVIGNWAGDLGNNGGNIQLDDAAGNTVDSITYASEGDWALRVRGPNDLGHYGWAWFTEADGLGKSLELINPNLSNKNGQNWGTSLPNFGTPGAPNSLLNTNTAPIILDVAHFPLIPKSTDPVTITARLLDEATNGLIATLFYRNASTTTPPAFSNTQMFDDGLHGDGLAGDGVFGANLPANPSGTIIEFYVQASDIDDQLRTWPAPARQLDGVTFDQTANALYQVDDNTYSGNQALYRLILTETERHELFDVIDFSAADSDAAMNGAFISLEPTGAELRYHMSYRNRGHGSRTAHPNNIRVNFPNDQTWHGVRAINLNSRYTHVQTFGSAIFQKAGLPTAFSRPVQVRVNAANLATSGSPMYGSYANNEEVSSEFVQNHFPLDSGGNAYRGIRVDPNQAYANLNYYGPDINDCGPAPACYLNLYFKQNNQSANDFSDILNLTRVLATAPDATYSNDVRQVLDVEDAMLYFAANTLADNRETSLSNGEGDDYAMYRGAIDTRMKLLPYDMDTLFNQGDSGGSITASLFRMTNSPGSGVDPVPTSIIRFMTWPDFVPIYYGALKKQAETTFSAAQFNPAVDRELGDWVPQPVVAAMKSWMASRAAFVLSQIPTSLTISSPLPIVSGYPQSSSSSTTVSGQAHAVDTRSVRVNGALAAWAPLTATWSAGVGGLIPGINRVLVQAFGTNGLEIARTNIDIWYNTGASTTVGGALAGSNFWAKSSSPYLVSSSLTIGSGATLRIEPGTTVFFGAGVGATVSGTGQLLAQGTDSAHIRIGHQPGSGNWASLDFLSDTAESRLAYVDFDGCGGTTIGSHNAQVHVNNSIVFIDHCTWPSTPVIEYISFDDSSFIVQNCFFPSYPPPTGPESLHGINGIPPGGYGIFRDNYFGHTWGFNDTIDFTGGNRPGPILQVINNVFDGASDDCLDLDSTDAWIEGNVFMHVHRDPTRTDNALDTSSAISGGVDFVGQNSDWTIINNIFYDVDHVFLNKGNSTTIPNGGGRIAFLYNTVIHVAKEYSGSTAAEIAAFDWSDDSIALPDAAIGSGMYAANNIIYDCSVLQRFYNPANHTVIFDNNILPVAWAGAGSGNQVIDPNLNLFSLGATAPTNATAAQVRLAAQLLAGSPALGAGFGGLNLGALQPHGIAIGGGPPAVTASTSASFLVGPAGTFTWGTNAPQPWGWTAFKWKLDGGAWSSEITVTNNSPFTNPAAINLTGLSNGSHTLYVSGRNDAPPGYYQDDQFVYPLTAGIPASVSTRAWTVNTSYTHLRLNEVLAKNVSAVLHNGGYPDVIEIYNDGGAAIDLSGVGLTDDSTDKFKFTFPPGTSIASGEYKVLFADEPDGSPGLHLGFALSAEGDSVLLYDTASNLVDSITFGVQLADFSIGRMPDGSWTLTQPTFGAANVRQGLGDPRLLKINEWLTASQNKSIPDFIELFNPDAAPVNVGGLFLSDAPQGAPNLNQIPALSFIAAGGFLSMIADGHPDKGADHLNFNLSSVWGQLGLFGPDLSLIDCIFYGAQSPDVSEGRTPSGSGTFGLFPIPTPGSANPVSDSGSSTTNITSVIVPLLDINNSFWSYDNSGTDFGTIWRDPDFDDSGWPVGQGLFGFETTPGEYFPYTFQTFIPAPNQTGGHITVYYRTHFTWDGSLTNVSLMATNYIDDGAVFYLNGVEADRLRVSGSPPSYFTFAQQQNAEGVAEVRSWPTANLVVGDNIVEVEVHQVTCCGGSTSSDDVFGMALSAVSSTTNIIINSSNSFVALNEVMANNVSFPNPDGTITDWVELYNPGALTADLSDLSLSDDVANARRWVFPAGVSMAPGAYLIVRFDSSTPPSTNNGPVLNTGFGLDADGDQVLLYDAPARGGALRGSVVFGAQAADYSIGRIPNALGQWALNLPTAGAANIAASLGNASLLKVNEWMADPKSGPDWFEIYNPNPQPVSLGGLYLTDDLNLRDQFRIAPLSFVGVGEDAFIEFFADSNTSKGPKHTNFKLSTSGESIGIFSAALTQIDGITFGPQQLGVSEGRFPDGSTNITRFPGTETPAASNLLPLNDIVVNEVLSRATDPLEQAIELRNVTTGSIDLSGWFLTNKRTDPRRFRIPNGTVLQPGGLAVFYEYQFNPVPGVLPSFALDGVHGDQVYLFPADSAGNLLGFRAGQSLDTAETGVSMGLYNTSIGTDFTALSQTTFGADSPASLAQFRTGTGLANGYPKVGPIVINELMYHPPPIGTNDNVDDEFIELKNISGATVTLFDPSFPTNTWHIRNGVDFNFPTNVSLASGGYLLVVSFDPVTNATALASFRANYGLSPSVPIYGPYDGKLDNGGETIELNRPDAPQPLGSPDAGFVPRILVDHVKYGDSAPWPSAADGNTNGVGLSLQRKTSTDYGNDPANWIAGVPTPGAATGAAIVPAPSILSLTAPQTVAPGTNLTLTVSALSNAPLTFQWRFNGGIIPNATNSSLILSSVQDANVGNYAVLVSNPAGAASGVTRVDLAVGPTITRQPQNVVTVTGGNAYFTVTARGTTPLRYLWKKGGNDIGGATNAALLLTNVQQSDATNYNVVVSNDYGSAPSAQAVLSLSASPAIIGQPQSTNVFVGATVTFSVSANGSPPLRYQWYFNNGAITNQTNATLTLVNVQLTDAGNYKVRVTNSVDPVGIFSAIANLFVLVPPTVRITATDPVAAEAGFDPGAVTIFRTGSGGTNRALTVFFNVSGTATPGSDYVALSSPATILAGTFSTTLTITPIDDAIVEPTETVIVTLLASPDYIVATQSVATVSILDNDNHAPSIMVTNPVNGAQFTAPVNVLLQAAASDSDGSVATVDYYFDGVNPLGTATIKPYSVTWTNAPAGNHVITAVATDNFGLSTTSAPVSILINALPQVSITSPANGASFVTPANITIVANPTDDVSVALVEFFSGGVLIGSRASAPYSITWSNVAVGSYVLLARVTDNLGATNYSAPVNISVIVPTPTFTDNFANRMLITGYTNFAVGTNINYTHETGEHTHYGGTTGTKSGWISWLAPDSGVCSMDTGGSSFDTVMAVYIGTVLSTLSQVASNDDGLGFGVQSQVSFNAVAGTTYQVAVDGFSPADSGAINFHLNLRVPAVVTTQPQTQIVDPGSNAVFSVTASGTPPLVYQWRYGVSLNDLLSNIPGATNRTYVVTNAQYTNAGFYAARVSSIAGTTNSQTAELIVRPKIVQGLVLTNHTFQLMLNGTPGKSYAIETATNMPGWGPLTTVTHTNVALQYLDTNAPAASNRMYRLRLLPSGP